MKPTHDRWPTCMAYLEAECNPLPPPVLPETVLYAHILWTLAESLGATNILEIGIGPTSVSGCTFVHSMAGRGGGMLYSLDIDEKLPQEKYREMATAHGVIWQVVHGDSMTLHESWAPAVLVDLLYVDGDHDYNHAYGDVTNYVKFLRPGGYLVIDDSATDGVQGAQAQLERDGFSFVHLSHHPPHGNGRLLWQKPTV